MAWPATSAAPAPNGGPSPVRAAWLTDAAALCVLKAALGAWLLVSGFSHVSDDDYARTVIAEQFAHAPRLDPSGTSWLPLPFWLAGSWMMVAGRSLGSARAIALVFGVLGVIAPYAAMRAIGVTRVAARDAAAIAMAVPWNVWLGAATVPDGWTGALLAAGAIAMSGRDHEPSGWTRRGWAALALLAASLSRYEAWPVCALFVGQTSRHVIVALRAEPSPARSAAIRRDVGFALIAAAGPLLWIAWNAHAHGSPFHFIARVTSFRRAIGAASIPLRDKLLGYPRALVEDTPEVVAMTVVAIAAMVVSHGVRARWGCAVAAAGAVIAFLVAGDLGDGAPTHHPARALASIWWIAIGAGADASRTLWNQPRAPGWRWAIGGIAVVAGLTWCLSLPSRCREWPGRGASDRRDVQIARGLDLRARGVTGADVTPCSFEHFALLAAWGEPERATVAPRTGAAPTDDCPRVTEK